MDVIENKTFDEIAVGDVARVVRTLNTDDIELFAAVSGDVNPAHLDGDFAKTTRFNGVIGHGMWGGALLSAVLGNELPGPGAIYVSQSLNFRQPARLGDTLTVEVRVREKQAGRKLVVLDCACVNQNGETVIDGEARVIAPTQKVRMPRGAPLNAYVYERGERLKALIAEAKALAPLRVAVVHPTNAVSLEGAVAAAQAGLIDPILVGPAAKIAAAAEEAGLDISSYVCVDAPHSHGAAESAVALARDGRADALMKGALHTDEIMGAVVDKTRGLRTERRISHIYVMDAPAYAKLLFVTDAAINIYPDLDAKRDIVQNAIDLVRALGVERPKVAILSAVETVYPPIASTVDAAALCKMADRGQIKGGVLDGPLAFDNAVSADAAATKGLASPVAGDADILVTPDLEAGNMLAKQMDYLAGATAAGVVLGARTPIILTSRAEKTLPRMASSAVASLYVRRQSLPDH